MQNRDYTLIIDKSGSMSVADQGGGLTRWQAAQESTLALARKCEQLDPDGITVYTFSSRFKRYDNVTAAKVEQIFLENDPVGRTDLAAVLQDATQNFLNRKNSPGWNKEGEIILVITDGEPDDQRAVIEVILQTTHRLDRDEELGISFIQVGNDPSARQFLKALDDQLEEVGAKFDICDTITMDDMADMSLVEVLMNAIED
ncbi:vWA domain-containing protein [Prochlorothrix hollandica]|uniref:von Willebrand factor A n=1 Tax=Prochlorothrix hollandica PCC 9006 = CALU 1027 TaxID=317619 RepID=A0A0M2PN90_PROHO|nr:VWA domain-containing protein [Prochlorothrix hollandica]KKI98070.1 von Willebrand factor A [Prochlorothrix hollandica PCC 9006 = CALU 1027]